MTASDIATPASARPRGPVPLSARGRRLASALKLEIVIRPDGLQVQDRHGGSLTPIGDRIPNVASGPDTRALAVLVQAIKTKFPQHDDATVLAETNTSYETLVRVMDAVRDPDLSPTDLWAFR